MFGQSSVIHGVVEAVSVETGVVSAAGVWFTFDEDPLEEEVVVVASVAVVGLLIVVVDVVVVAVSVTMVDVAVVSVVVPFVVTDVVSVGVVGGTEVSTVGTTTGVTTGAVVVAGMAAQTPSMRSKAPFLMVTQYTWPVAWSVISMPLVTATTCESTLSA